MSGDSVFTLCVMVACDFFAIGYFSGRSDERDAEIRRAIVKNCSRKG